MLGHYINYPNGQLHLRTWGLDKSGIPLICLPPSPFSSLAYVTLAPYLAETRPVIALDYPGYGNSTACDQPATISGYAQSVDTVLQHFSSHKSFDLLGFHTGCLVAVESSLIAKDKVNQLLLIDCPFFSREKQATLMSQMGQPIELSSELSMLQKTWDFCISSRLEHIPLSRAYDMFIDHIRTGINTNQAFAAAFNYPCKERFEKVRHPCTVFATKAGLYQESIDTSKTIKGASLVELVEIETAVLEQGAAQIAAAVSKSANDPHRIK